MSGRVLITGASSGLGRQLAMDYRQAGWQVWGCGRDGERLARWQAGPSADLVAGAGGECLAEVEARAFRALARACAGLPADATVLIVAHDAVNRVLLCRILGIPLSKLWGFRQAPTTINLLEGASVDALEVVRLNDCSHHTALFGEAKHRAL